MIKELFDRWMDWVEESDSHITWVVLIVCWTMVIASGASLVYVYKDVTARLERSDLEHKWFDGGPE